MSMRGRKAATSQELHFGGVAHGGFRAASAVAKSRAKGRRAQPVRGTVTRGPAMTMDRARNFQQARMRQAKNTGNMPTVGSGRGNFSKQMGQIRNQMNQARSKMATKPAYARPFKKSF